jgi:hypothetical protein
VKNTNTHRTIVALAFPVRVAALISLAKAIVDGLNGNPSFPNPDPSIAALNAAIAELETAETAANTRVHGAVATRDQKRAALIALLRGAKAFVQKIADAHPDTAPALIQSAAMGVKRPTGHGKRVFSVKQGTLSRSRPQSRARAPPTSGSTARTEEKPGCRCRPRRDPRPRSRGCSPERPTRSGTGR